MIMSSVSKEEQEAIWEALYKLLEVFSEIDKEKSAAREEAQQRDPPSDPVRLYLRDIGQRGQFQKH